MSSPVENTRAVVTFVEACAARHHGQHEHAAELIESLEGDDLLGGGIGSLILTAQSWAESNRQAFFLLKGVGMILTERAIRDIDLIPRTYFDALDGLGTALLGIFAADEQTVLEYPGSPVLRTNVVCSLPPCTSLSKRFVQPIRPVAAN